MAREGTHEGGKQLFCLNSYKFCEPLFVDFACYLLQVEVEDDPAEAQKEGDDGATAEVCLRNLLCLKCHALYEGEVNPCQLMWVIYIV
jgi:hypothetical protein